MISEKKIPTRIIIIEDNRFIRSGIEMVLNAEADFKVIGSYSNCEEAFFRNRISEAELVVMDIKLPGISGVEGVKYLKEHFPQILTIVYSAFEDDVNIFNAINAGATGFVSKKTTSKELVSILKTVLNGGSPLTPDLARHILVFYENHSIKEFKLNEIEEKVLHSIASGKSYSTIARELTKTEINILRYIRSIYLKVQNNKNQLTIEGV